MPFKKPKLNLTEHISKRMPEKTRLKPTDIETLFGAIGIDLLKIEKLISEKKLTPKEIKNEPFMDEIKMLPGGEAMHQAILDLCEISVIEKIIEDLNYTNNTELKRATGITQALLFNQIEKATSGKFEEHSFLVFNKTFNPLANLIKKKNGRVKNYSQKMERGNEISLKYDITFGLPVLTESGFKLLSERTKDNGFSIHILPAQGYSKLIKQFAEKNHFKELSTRNFTIDKRNYLVLVLKKIPKN